MSHNIVIQEGAVIISDAHYSHFRPELYTFIKEIHSQKKDIPQLILMGDIFDALFGGVEHTYRLNEKMIHLLNEISQRVEVIYLEGNHDFNLKTLFPKVQVIPISAQPILVRYRDKKVCLAHGDFDVSILYRVYTWLIRSQITLFMLKSIDNISKHFILHKLDAYLSRKDDCKEFFDFKKFIEKRLAKKYECDFFIEGHFHQNNSFRVGDFYYINLGAFACNQRYFIVESLQDNNFLEEKRLSQGDV